MTTANLGFNQKYIFEREGRVLLNIFFFKRKKLVQQFVAKS